MALKALYMTSLLLLSKAPVSVLPPALVHYTAATLYVGQTLQVLSQGPVYGCSLCLKASSPDIDMSNHPTSFKCTYLLHKAFTNHTLLKIVTFPSHTTSILQNTLNCFALFSSHSTEPHVTYYTVYSFILIYVQVLLLKQNVSFEKVQVFPCCAHQCILSTTTVLNRS